MSCLIAVAALSGPARADELLAARLADLLGQEREALAIAASVQLAATTVPPPPGAVVLAAEPALVSGDVRAALVAAAVPEGDAEWRCLAEALYFEARGESLRGVFAVGEVILNRVDSPDYPATICGVVHQGTGERHQCQFSYTCDGHADRITEAAAWDRVARVARALLDGAPRDLTDGATHYHSRAVHPSWANRLPRTAEIGAHRFYRAPTRIAAN